MEKISSPRDQYILGKQLMQLIITFMPFGVAGKIGKVINAGAKVGKAGLLAISITSKGPIIHNKIGE